MARGNDAMITQKDLDEYYNVEKAKYVKEILFEK
jgi:hypothetical protein